MGTALCASMWQNADARQINLRGLVSDIDGKPLNAVCIFDAETNELLATTNDEGKYMVVVEDDAKLIFSIMGMEDQEVRVDGKLALDVTLVRSSIVLNEVLVKGKSKLKVVAPEPTEMELKGNHITIKNRIRVPGRRFNTSTRLIIQPELLDVTSRKITHMKPVILDGWRYHDTQNRMLDFNAKDEDPLWSMATTDREYKRTGGDIVVTYNDSIWVDYPKHDFKCDMIMVLENYNKVFYMDTTTVARGIVNPLRFFQYDILAKEVSDSTFFPSPQMQLRDTKGDVMLTFDVGKATLDLNKNSNRASLDSLLDALHSIEANPDAAIKSFAIYCTSSPEGSYKRNLELSHARMNTAMDLIFNSLSSNTRKYAQRSTDAKVEGWETLVTLMRQDSLLDEADKVQQILDNVSDVDRRSARIKRLPFYSSVIATNYLPKMRKVSYEFVTSQYRYLTDDEIEQQYNKDPKSLSQFEYFRLYRYGNKSEAEKEKILRNALKVHPNFIVGANDLSAMLINRGEADATILEPFMKPTYRKKKPNEVLFNQVAACLAQDRFHEADSIAQHLPEGDELFESAKTYAAIFNGRFDGALGSISKESPLNEVVLLLCLKANDQAWNKAQKLGNTPEEEYVKAIAANRTDNYDQAINHLKTAIKLKPELLDVAKVDGDMIELLEDLELDNNNE